MRSFFVHCFMRDAVELSMKGYRRQTLASLRNDAAITNRNRKEQFLLRMNGSEPQWGDGIYDCDESGRYDNN